MSEKPSVERRHFSRIKFDAKCTLTQSSKTFEAELADISLNGLLVKTPEVYAVVADMPVELHIDLGEGTSIHMHATLAHSSHNVLGFHCTSIDMDSICHLRRLIELNLGDESASERVLSELLDPHH